jgi:mannose/fructose-specific phosphotransferase system component IIA
MSEAALARGVILAHGAMAQGMVDAVARIAGVDEGTLMALSNEGRSPAALESELDQMLGQGPAVIFTDLAQGSCALTAQVCCRGSDHRAVVFGVNLPLLLDFVFHRDLPLPRLVPRLLQKGRASLRSNPEYETHVDPPA